MTPSGAFAQTRKRSPTSTPIRPLFVLPLTCGRREACLMISGPRQPSSATASARTTSTKSLATMASACGRSRLVDLKAVGPGFPFHGRVVLDPPRDVSTLTPRECAVAPEVLEGLHARLGDELSIGAARYTIAAVVVEEPGRLDFSFTIGPRVMLSLAGLDAAQLEGFGRRVVERRLWAFEGNPASATIEALARRLRAELPDAAYLKFRLVTAYGGSGGDPRAEDLITYLHWCRACPEVTSKSQ